MPIIEVQIRPIKKVTTEIEFVEDLEALVESEKCSCSAGDDVPF
ncbi:hypothetical protein ACFH04_11815 [Streptomyces noboritoensis]|uniref:Uncharacterized protein n=1 Tax=Streptomyces noboritoensis TaxID=67337 RepID=A0ABV6TGZ1_9ACTN